MEKKKKKFLKVPTLGGGRELLKKHIREHMVYPAEALEKGVEGDVVIEYRVNNLGAVIDAHVLHGIGHGCDEEALRLVRMLQYQEVRNRGIKVTTNNKIKIPFRLKNKQLARGISITYKAGKTETKVPSDKKEKQKETYTYSIKL